MRVVFDIEADGLTDVKHIWLIVCKDIDTGVRYVFRESEQEAFKSFAERVTLWIGHNVISYDCYWLSHLLGISFSPGNVLDTYVLSMLLNVGREGGHSLESWGLRLKFPKGDFHDFSQWSQEMEDYCIQDVELNHRVYITLWAVVERNPGAFDKAIEIEMYSMWVANDMHHNGFKFNIKAAMEMRSELETKLQTLLQSLQGAFPPKAKLIREVTPKLTKHGTISKVGLQWYKDNDYTIFQADSPFSLVEFVPFNPSSVQQIIERLWEAGWKPINKTKGHMDAIKARDKAKIKEFQTYGWKVDEVNIATLPEEAPEACNLLVEFILTSARVRTLTEWIGCFNKYSGRIHGRFNPLGTRTHRASHSNPNMGNIATKKSIKYNTPRLRDLALEYGGRMRSLWICDEGAYLVGTDMESAHLRIFAHLIDDKEFIQSLITGDKKNGTDPHSVNKRVLGDICVDRDRSKTFIFSFLNGAASPKVSEIFSCSLQAAKEALDRFVRGYPGLARLKSEAIPRDAERGYFEGIDGRLVVNDSEHLMIGMYLQNMESVLMKWANKIWRDKLERLGVTFRQVNWVHDEWVTEVSGPRCLAGAIGRMQSDSIREVGELFGLRCPMGGEYKTGKNWLEVH
jgi:DNA polymerase-1